MLLQGTKIIVSKLYFSLALLAKTIWPLCIGSKLPPYIPILSILKFLPFLLFYLSSNNKFIPTKTNTGMVNIKLQNKSNFTQPRVKKITIDNIIKGNNRHKIPIFRLIDFVSFFI